MKKITILSNMRTNKKKSILYTFYSSVNEWGIQRVQTSLLGDVRVECEYCFFSSFSTTAMFSGVTTSTYLPAWIVFETKLSSLKELLLNNRGTVCTIGKSSPDVRNSCPKFETFLLHTCLQTNHVRSYNEWSYDILVFFTIPFSNFPSLLSRNAGMPDGSTTIPWSRIVRLATLPEWPASDVSFGIPSTRCSILSTS